MVVKRRTLLSWAVGTLQEWFEGWTDASLDTNFMQYKIVHEEYTKRGLIFRLQTGPGNTEPEPEEVYEIIVKVKRLK
jgi:hypothetical protein